VRKRGDGWLHKKDLDLGENDQALSDIRNWIARYFGEVEPKNIIKASVKEEKKVRLDVFRPENIAIDVSIRKFQSKSRMIVAELEEKAERRKIWKGTKPLLEKEEYKELIRQVSIMERQMGLVKEAAKIMGWSLYDKEWEKLLEKSIGLIEKYQK
jgi:hypothetical protein